MSLFRNKNGNGGEMTFFEHIDALRGHLFRSAIAVFSIGVLVFINKSFIFDTVLFGPKQPDFITYRWMNQLATKLDMPSLRVVPPNFKVMSQTLAGQFMAHIQISLTLGLVLAIPYVFWEFWRFLTPGLYVNERKAAKGIVFYATSLFLIGAAFGYYLLTPFSIAFLADYHVSDDVIVMPTLDEYIDFVTSMVLVTGIAFELPIVMYFLGKIGLISGAFLKQYRRFAIVVVLFLSAIITPSVDMFTQFLVAVPLYALYELSIFVVLRNEKQEAVKEQNEDW
jgi:sec-independent protein translocase protein TatC